MAFSKFSINCVRALLERILYCFICACFCIVTRLGLTEVFGQPLHISKTGDASICIFVLFTLGARASIIQSQIYSSNLFIGIFSERIPDS